MWDELTLSDKARMIALAVRSGISDLRTIQELLGHSDIVTTRIYTHVAKKQIHDNYDKYELRGDDDAI